MHAMYRVGGVRTVVESGDRALYAPRDPEEVATRCFFWTPPWRQPRGKLMVSLVKSHTNATRIGWHLWGIDLRLTLGLPPGWFWTRLPQSQAET